MRVFISDLKNVVFIILICEFLKELLTTKKFKPYLHFAISLFLFSFFLSILFHTDFSIPDFTGNLQLSHQENLLISQYEAQIAQKIAEHLSQNHIPVTEVLVTLSDTYEIKAVKIISDSSPESIQSILKGDFPYEVVPTA